MMNKNKVKEVLVRLKSPVVIIQIVTILASLTVTILPEANEQISHAVHIITVIVNLFAGVNNPTDLKNF